MLPRYLLVTGAVAVIVMAAACSVLKKEGPEKEIRAFIISFQNSLAQSDQEILKLFETRQSDDVVLTAIHILQNKEHNFINCAVELDQAQIMVENGSIRVMIPSSFQAIQNLTTIRQDAVLTLWLKAKNRSYVIEKLEGEAFYKAFADIRNILQYGDEGQQELAKREPIYAQAKTIQMNFDSVIWYATCQGKNYFYVVEGTWKNLFMDRTIREQNNNHRMGLVDDLGKIVIPVEYELIGTLGFTWPDLVEVRKDGKSGYFNIATRQLIIEPLYDMIVPYAADNVTAIVKRDTVFGWIDHENKYQPGFPSEEAQQWVNSYAFLPKYLKLGSDTKTLCEIPLADHAGYGIVLLPSYLVKTGIFSEIIGGISTTAVPISGWTDYVETQGSLLQAVTDKINALITRITESYIEGREAFYTESRLVFVNARHDTLAVTDIPSDSILAMQRIDSTLLEVKSPTPYYAYEMGEYSDMGMPIYTYFRLGDDLTVTPLKTHRMFPQTAFVKLDSSYLTGSFTHWDTLTQAEVQTTFVSASTLEYMRDEILASYGLRFADPRIAESFSISWYEPRYDTVEEFQDQLTDIDRHNLLFLEKIIALLKSNPV